MNKPPAFQFYPKDFIVDDKVAVMNMEARGVYITLLCFCWNNNGLTNDQEELKEMCGNPENWEKIWKKVGKCFYENNGKLYNKRLDKERKKQEFWREKSKEGGIKSGESRRKKVKSKGGSNEIKGGSQMVEPKANHSVSPVSSLQSSSSTSISKKTYAQNELEELFEKWWKRYPRIEDKGKAKSKYFNLIENEGTDPQLLEDALTGYIRVLNNNETPKQYIKHAKTFLYNGNKEKNIPSTWEQFVKFANPKYKAAPPL